METLRKHLKALTKQHLLGRLLKILRKHFLSDSYLVLVTFEGEVIKLGNSGVPLAFEYIGETSLRKVLVKEGFFEKNVLPHLVTCEPSGQFYIFFDLNRFFVVFMRDNWERNADYPIMYYRGWCIASLKSFLQDFLQGNEIFA